MQKLKMKLKALPTKIKRLTRKDVVEWCKKNLWLIMIVFCILLDVVSGQYSFGWVVNEAWMAAAGWLACMANRGEFED